MVGAVFHRGDITVPFSRIPDSEHLRVCAVARPELNGPGFFQLSTVYIHTEVGSGAAVGIVDRIDVVIAIAEVVSRGCCGSIAVLPEDLRRHGGGDIGTFGAAHISGIVVRQRADRFPFPVDHDLEGHAVALRCFAGGRGNGNRGRYVVDHKKATVRNSYHRVAADPGNEPAGDIRCGCVIGETFAGAHHFGFQFPTQRVKYLDGVKPVGGFVQTLNRIHADLGIIGR